MKKFLLLTAILFSGVLAFSQTKAPVVCHGPATATQQFAMLADDDKFVMSHKKPLPLHFQSSIGKAITYKTADGKTAGAYELKAKNPTNNYILVVHEWWGLNDWVKKESEKIYNDLGNVTIIDLDLYDGKVATNPQDAGKYMQGLSEDRAKAIINGAIAYVGPKAHIATIGWCFGGGWSLQTTILSGKQAVACVMYYGMPEQNLAALKALNCDVLGNFANKDKWINPKVVAKFETDMKTAGKKLTVNKYDADHGFANPSNPVYSSDATKDAYGKTIAFFKARLK
ncbi:dienelactone hydrolase family protein [Mucilaginibacter sp. BJC16-A38]|uniref:dienelactone hydrolase family protein n=1 Tax=Mucilaginibacter phenanthrenivorans TaxID=1234842 RepID=UPI002157046C|nr:dienelactone hydrolase family protein [Mucilaginibacter phenanthrenivorans]MCR8558013.1 dienelactone hydrolase family protein [Mucilaginibacter phenanthrenivorans]